MSGEMMKWADQAMYEAAPMVSVTPKVFLLNATADPLGSVAAMFRMYQGKPTYALSEVTDDERREAFYEVQKTHLQTPFEAVRFHFFIEGVTRAWTHQAVRKRQNAYAQESLRFAVKRGLAKECVLPPSMVGMEGDAIGHGHNLFDAWMLTIKQIEETYNLLVDNGIPAEDARGLLPHCVTTRMNYLTDLRTLVDELGNRLCTQAQFEWRTVAIGMLNAIKHRSDIKLVDPNDGKTELGEWQEWGDDAWQWHLIATGGLFAPVCYRLGHCGFESVADRQCTIRERANRGAFNEIKVEEWMADPTAGRRD